MVPSTVAVGPGVSYNRRVRRLIPAALALSLSLSLVAACGHGGGGHEASPTPAGSPGVTVTPVQQSPIFDVAFPQAPEVAEFLASAGGEVRQDAILFADLTGDGQEEAIVPVSSGGTAGDIAYFVYTMRDGALDLLLSVVPETGRVQVEVGPGGRLTERQPVYGPQDPECCPSRVRTRIYAWDGQRLGVVSDDTEEGGPGAKTPSSE